MRKKPKSAVPLPRRYRQRAARLGRTGPILQGTITARTIPRAKGKGRKEEKSYGPYYQWTFKEQGKTVTVNLTAAQAKLYQEAIDDNRAVEEILRKMRRLSKQIFEAKTEGVKKRNSVKSFKKALS